MDDVGPRRLPPLPHDYGETDPLHLLLCFLMFFDTMKVDFVVRRGSPPTNFANSGATKT